MVSPFVQAAYFSLTDWTGFSTGMNFVGLELPKLFDDSTFLKAMSNNILMAIVVPIVTLGLAMFFATLVTVGGSTRGNIRGLRNSSFYRVISFFPYVIPASSSDLSGLRSTTPAPDS